MYMATRNLREKDRRFLGLIARAAFANPFSRTRLALEQKMIESAGAGVRNVPGEGVGDLATEAVEQRLREISRSAGDRLGHYQGIDRKLMRTAFLYRVFHRFLDDFDSLIREQVAAGDTPCRVSCAEEIVTQVEGHDFTREEALLYLGFFYQLRRAYFFIRQGLVGESPSMRELRRHLWNSVFTFDIRWYEQYLWNRMEDFSTLLLGETGTGKGTAAAAIGRSIFIPFDEKAGCFKESFTRNFVSINLSRFPESIIESELFGHRKGAFTGAIEHFEGILARCSPHGAIFLDEIGDVSAHIQVKLLEVLQERTFSPVGSHDKLQFPSRVIAATNKPLDDLRQKGEMRDDFYYRLCSNTITVPPLRDRIKDRPEELDLLLGHVIKKTIGKESPRLVKTIRRILRETVGPGYSWPGNVRELEQAVRRILITRSYDGDTRRERLDAKGRLHRAIDSGEAGAYEILSAYCSILYEEHGTYEEVSRITGLDRRTVKKYLAAEKS
jgi:DNA-binding NtrC family response regulator